MPSRGTIVRVAILAAALAVAAAGPAAADHEDADDRIEVPVRASLDLGIDCHGAGSASQVVCEGSIVWVTNASCTWPYPCEAYFYGNETGAVLSIEGLSGQRTANGSADCLNLGRCSASDSHDFTSLDSGGRDGCWTGTITAEIVGHGDRVVDAHRTRKDRETASAQDTVCV